MLSCIFQWDESGTCPASSSRFKHCMLMRGGSSLTRSNRVLDTL